MCNMKILSSIQATGIGHINRALEVLPYLLKYGKVDLFLSGSNSQMDLPYPVTYRSRGVSSALWEINPFRTIREARQLPVEKYDLVINDFECITTIACYYKKVKSLNFGHQASFQSPLVPRPAHRNIIGELLFKYYGTATRYMGLHFRSYDTFIYTPIIKKKLLWAPKISEDHVTVYLPHYRTDRVVRQLKKLKTRFILFSPEVEQPFFYDNVTLYPIDPGEFALSISRAYGVITSAGFDKPAETLWLGKKLLCLPIRDQYTQLCNAEALKDFGVPILGDPEELDSHFAEWREGGISHAPLTLTWSTGQLIDRAVFSMQ